MAILEHLLERARQAQKRIVLPEGHDPRVVIAANKIMEYDIASEVIVLGTEEELKKSCVEAGIKDRNFKTIDYTTSDLLPSFADKFIFLRGEKGKIIDHAQALDAMKSRIFFGAMMTKLEIVDGLVAGSIASTGDMLRAAFAVVGTKKGIKTASSAFIMDLLNPTPGGESTLLFADCAVVPNPDAETLVDIALATAHTHKSIVGTIPKIAMLSFSTKGSADHPLIEKVRNATAMLKEAIAKNGFNYIVDGELQADAAIVPKIAASKSPGSPLLGNANILIFPDLNVGNICYKLVQRLAGANAIGPALQGLGKPLNDLSRGCSADDIVGTAAITACQAIEE